jgi:hypothetical protein
MNNPTCIHHDEAPGERMARGETLGLNLFPGWCDQWASEPSVRKMIMSPRKPVRIKAVRREAAGAPAPERLDGRPRERRVADDEPAPHKDGRLRWRQFVTALRTQAAQRGAQPGES